MYVYMYTVFMTFFNLHHSGIQVFLENIDIFFGPEKSPASFSGGVSDVEPQRSLF